MKNDVVDAVVEIPFRSRNKYEEDELDCFAFKVDDDGVVYVYNWNQPLVDFVMRKIKEHYEK